MRQGFLAFNDFFLGFENFSTYIMGRFVILDAYRSISRSECFIISSCKKRTMNLMKQPKKLKTMKPLQSWKYLMTETFNLDGSHLYLIFCVTNSYPAGHLTCWFVWLLVRLFLTLQLVVSTLIILSARLSVINKLYQIIT